MKISPSEASRVLAEADLLHSPEAINDAIERMAGEMHARLVDQDPILLCMMTGGMAFCAELAAQLKFPLEIDYLHLTRYRGQTAGGQLAWLRTPSASLQERCVVLVDDILDEGHTLVAARQFCQESGANVVLSAVLVEKLHDRRVPGLTADFVGLPVVDRYVFGHGMDYKNYWRNLPGIYAVAGS